MRDIKFRGKLINSNKWAEGNLQITKQGTTIITPDETVLGSYGKVESNTVGQYTGLKDKNGKEIYEGDIVSEKGHYVNSDKLLYQKIQWKENYSCWLRGEYQRLTPKNIKNYSIEVIGNIYDNPELLEEKE